jgi:putative Mg2+ transporter-C (MgtC) family protein
VPDLSLLEALARLTLAAALGATVGLEREIREREAGLRTHLLVALGACLFVLVSGYAWHDFTFSNRSGVTFDPTRVAAQIVSGIGFLGAGAIIVRGLSVRGLTTAATLWVVAAIGMAAGTGFYWEAVGTTAIVLISLWPLRLIAFRIVVRIRPEEGRLFVEVREQGSRASVLTLVERLGGEIMEATFREDGTLEVDMRGGTRENAARIAEAVASLDEVTRVQWKP